MRQRIFALIVAILFLVTTVGAGLAVLWQMHQDSQRDKNLASSQKQLEDLQKQSDCSLGQDKGPKEPAPKAYKPQHKVSKIEITDLTPGNGQAAKPGDCLIVKYNGTLAANGKQFDGNFDQPTALRFPLGKGQVIPGWDQGLIGLKVGGTRRLVIAPELAYGAKGQGEIPANATLVFVVKLIKIQ